MRDKYVARANRGLRFNEDQMNFLHRRTMPFLDAVGVQAHSIQTLLQEAYLQGVRDAVEVYTEKNQTTQSQ